MRAWPTIVADSAIAPLADRIAAKKGHAVLLVGPAGVGTSTVASLVADRLEERGLEVLRATALLEISTMPLGALLPLLSRTADGQADTTERQLERLFARLSRSSASTVLVIDDVSMLDPVSAATVHQLVRNYGVRCILTARSSHSIGGPIARLEDAGLIARVTVRGLLPNEAAEVIEQALGTPVEAESLMRLVQRADGVPLFLRLLVEAAERDGLIRPGPRGVEISRPALPDRIVSIVSEPLAALHPEHLRTLRLVATASRLPVEAVRPDALSRLERLDLLSRIGDSVTPAHPLVGEVIIEGMSGTELDELRIEAAGALMGASDDDRLTAISLLADSSRPPGTADLAWAARRATFLDRYELAISLAEHASRLAGERGETIPIEALIMRGESLSFLGRLDEADVAFTAALGSPSDDAGIALAASRAGFHWAIRRAEPRRAIELADAALLRIHEPEAAAYLSTNAAKWRLMVGDHDNSSVSSGSLTGSDVAVAAAALDSSIFSLVTAIFAGDPVTARAAITAGRPHAEAARPMLRHGAELLDFGAMLVVVLDGRLDDAGDLAQHRAAERFTEAAGMWSYGAALVHLHAGHLDLALSLAKTAVEQLAWRDFLGAQGAAIALQATAEALMGRPTEAVETLNGLSPSLRGVVTANLQASEAEAWMLARDGDRPAAAQRIAVAVDLALGTGYAGWIALAAHTAVRLGHPEAVIDSLRAAAARSDARMLALVLGHAEALIANDPVALIAVSGALEHAGFRAGAYDAARQSIASATAADRADLARHGTVIASRIGATLSPAPIGIGAGALLTAREWSIATAAAGRERNREIADRLGLSLRTVENHLANVYRKLGVRGRDELSSVLD